MNIGLIIIGDEILSGKRQDKHLGHVIPMLAERGLTLSWCQIIGDDPARITQTLKQAMSSNDVVFCCGGIGATPDDYTRQCAADAAGVSLVRHPQALAEIEARFGAEAYPNRVKMADLPENCSIIPNPVNRVPGFSVGHVHFLPGFPEMAWPMAEWVLDKNYQHLEPNEREVENLFILPNAKEADLLEVMETLVKEHPALKLSSLPSYGNAHIGPHIELGLKGSSIVVTAASAQLKTLLDTRSQAFYPK